MPGSWSQDNSSVCLMQLYAIGMLLRHGMSRLNACSWSVDRGTGHVRLSLFTHSSYLQLVVTSHLKEGSCQTQPGLGARLILLEEIGLRCYVCGSQCSKGGAAQGAQGGLGSLRPQRLHQ